MTTNLPDIEHHLVDRIRAGQTQAWQDFIDRFEGRLFSYVHLRIMDRAAAAAYKLTDHLRREGRRFAVQLVTQDNSSEALQRMPSGGRQASSIVRSHEQKDREEEALVAALREQLSKWQDRGDYQKLKCIEMLFVLGLGNKEVAQSLEISEQQVANYKSDFLTRTKSLIHRQAAREHFPELDSQ